MSKSLSGLLGDEQWKRCQELLRPPSPEVPEVLSIRTYVKDKKKVVEENDTLQPCKSFVVSATQSRVAEQLWAGAQGPTFASPLSSPLAACGINLSRSGSNANLSRCGSNSNSIDEDWLPAYVALQVLNALIL
jgi:hypothetical protein